MVRNTAVSGNDGRGRFARPPWTKKSSEWRRIDARIADGHLAHHVNQAVGLLDLTPARHSGRWMSKRTSHCVGSCLESNLLARYCTDFAIVLDRTSTCGIDKLFTWQWNVS